MVSQQRPTAMSRCLYLNLNKDDGEEERQRGGEYVAVQVELNIGAKWNVNN